jgi:hypothetical protein
MVVDDAAKTFSAENVLDDSPPDCAAEAGNSSGLFGRTH